VLCPAPLGIGKETQQALQQPFLGCLLFVVVGLARSPWAFYHLQMSRFSFSFLVGAQAAFHSLFAHVPDADVLVSRASTFSFYFYF